MSGQDVNVQIDRAEVSPTVDTTHPETTEHLETADDLDAPREAATAPDVDASDLESALTALEREADATVRALSGALREAKRVKTAAAQGQIRDVHAALDGAARLAASAAEAAAGLKDGWRFDVHAHLADGGYATEILALAAEAGLSAFEADGRILSYPAIVQTSSGDASVLVDRRRERRIRPSVLVRTLKALQARPPKFKADAFLESLATAYDLVISRSGARRGATVKLADLYAVLTVLPGSAREYTKAEFARDLYLVDQSGVTGTRDGRTLRLPASALTRGGGVLVTVARSGQEKVYAGVCFEEST